MAEREQEMRAKAELFSIVIAAALSIGLSASGMFAQELVDLGPDSWIRTIVKSLASGGLK